MPQSRQSPENSLASAARAPLAEGTLRVLWIIARRELRDALRSRWFAIYTGSFVLLGFGVAYLSGGGQGIGGFGRTTAGLINLVTLVVPLMALSAGAGSIASERERGMLPYLLSQPISRGELLLGKWLGLSLALASCVLLGFGVCALGVAWRGGSAGAMGFVIMAGLTLVLAIGLGGLGLLLSVLSRRTSVATGLAVCAWLLLVLGTDLGLIAGSLTWRLTIQSIFMVCIVNPLQCFKLWALDSTGVPLDVLGPVGQYTMDHYANTLSWIAAGSMTLWAVLPACVAALIFNRRSVT